MAERTTPSLLSAWLRGPARRPYEMWRSQPVLAGFVAFGVAFGAFLRVWALGRGTINSDNAVVGLMAREALHGHFFAFYWGQPYGGAEAYAVAIVFAIFGVSAFTLNLTPAILVAVAAVLAWRVGNRLLGSPIGAIAAVLFWVWPQVYVTSSIVEDGFRWLVLVCGMCVLLFVLRLRDGCAGIGGGLGDGIGLGLAAGVGWWASPEMAYYLLPAGLYLAVLIARRIVRLGAGRVAAGVIAAGLGSLPWWWRNLPNHFVSMHAPTQPSPQAFGAPKGEGPYLFHLNLLAHEVFPIALGLKLQLTGYWLGPSNIAKGLTVAAFAACALTVLALIVSNRAWLLVLFVVAFPFVYAESPFAWYWQDGRYGVFLAPGLALLFACFVGLVLDLPEGARSQLTGRFRRGASASAGAPAGARSGAPAGASAGAGRASAGDPDVPARRGRRLVSGLAAAVLLVPAMTLTAAADRHVDPYRPNPIAGPGRAHWTSWTSNPNNLPAELGSALERWGVRDAYAGYWLAYDVTFLTDKRVLVTPSGPAYVRYPPYFRAVSASAHPAWIFVSTTGQLAAGTEAQTVIIDPGCNAPGQPCLVVPMLVSWCRAHHLTYQERVVGPYIVVIPGGRVLPGPLFRHVGITG